MFLFASVLPLMKEPSSETFLNLNTRQMLYSLAWRIMQLQSRLWGFLSCKGHMAAVCTFPAHKASGLDPAMKTCALHHTPAWPKVSTNPESWVSQPRTDKHWMQGPGCQVLYQGVAQLRESRELSPSPRLHHMDGHQAISVLQQEGKALQQQSACRGYSSALKALLPNSPHSIASTGLNFAGRGHPCSPEQTLLLHIALIPLLSTGCLKAEHCPDSSGNSYFS